MGQALYRKYRSKSLSEIVGQEHITGTLDRAIKAGKISHAYLFTGPRGVGKTSIARILAHEINQLPYTDESIHLDIIEIDAASNRGVEDIRELREKVHTAPTSAKYKVYIIDEVHMLTKEAFNALLKTLEEPPAHVVFILATTELHKLPETIVSRAQKFTFKPIESGDAVKHLRAIAKSEKIDIDDDALELIATQGKGSFRDSISLLDQVSGSGKITRADAERLTGQATHEHIENIMKAVFEGKPADIVATLDKLIDEGISPAQAARQLSAELRSGMLSGRTSPAHVELLGNLISVSGSPDPAGALEVSLFRANLDSVGHDLEDAKSIETAPAKATTKAGSVQTPEPEAKTNEEEAKPAHAPETKKTTAEPSAKPPQTKNTGEPASWWGDVLKEVKNINNTLHGAMRMATPLVDGDTLNLGFKFKLHANKVSEAGTQAKLREAVEKVTGTAFKINAIVDKTLEANPQNSETDQTKAEPSKPVDINPQLDSVKNIFGGAEVLES